MQTVVVHGSTSPTVWRLITPTCATFSFVLGALTLFPPSYPISSLHYNDHHLRIAGPDPSPDSIYQKHILV